MEKKAEPAVSTEAVPNQEHGNGQTGAGNGDGEAAQNPAAVVAPPVQPPKPGLANFVVCF
jgi:hypothetical protein